MSTRGPIYRQHKEKLPRGPQPRRRIQDRCPAEQPWDSDNKIRIENQTKGLNAQMLKVGAKYTEYIDGRPQWWRDANKPQPIDYPLIEDIEEL